MYIFTLSAAVIFFGVGLYLTTAPAINEMRINLKAINERGVMAENLPWTLSELVKFVKYHSLLKELSIDDDLAQSPDAKQYFKPPFALCHLHCEFKPIF